MSIAVYLVWSSILLWLMIMLAGLARYKAWTPSGLVAMMGNHEHDEEVAPFVGRAERAAHNMIESFVLFIALAAAAYFAGKADGQATTGAAVFFWARLVYWPVYLIGIPYLRTGVWAVGIVGLAMMALAVL